MNEQQIIERKTVASQGFISFIQDIIQLTQEGYILDVSNRYCPQFQIGLFTANMILLKEDEQTQEEQQTVPLEQEKPKQRGRKVVIKESLQSKLPAEALQTITKEA